MSAAADITMMASQLLSRAAETRRARKPVYSAAKTAWGWLSGSSFSE
jgi:hypothetical protein